MWDALVKAVDVLEGVLVRCGCSRLTELHSPSLHAAYEDATYVLLSGQAVSLARSETHAPQNTSPLVYETAYHSIF